MDRIRLFKVFTPPNLGETLQRDVFDTEMLTEGKWADAFEEGMGQLVGTKNTVLMNSCTAALTIAYRLSGVGPGKEVICTPMTCMATNEPVDTLGGDIVWADIDPNTGNIDPDDIEQLITDKTVAISAVHWAGTPFNMKAVYAIARRHKLKVIDDAAHALGAQYQGELIGSSAYSDFSCFSFQAIKHLTTDDGGMLTCRLDADAKRARELRWFGLNRKYVGSKWEQDIAESGYKFHMNDINARIGVAQLPHSSRLLMLHRANAHHYKRAIDNSRVQKLDEPTTNYTSSSHWIYTIKVDDREAFKKHMDTHDIDVDVVHVRNDNYSAFKRFKKRELPGCDEFCSSMINIPVGWWLTTIDVNRVIDAVNSYGVK